MDTLPADLITDIFVLLPISDKRNFTRCTKFLNTIDIAPYEKKFVNAMNSSIRINMTDLEKYTLELIFNDYNHLIPDRYFCYENKINNHPLIHFYCGFIVSTYIKDRLTKNIVNSSDAVKNILTKHKLDKYCDKYTKYVEKSLNTYMYNYICGMALGGHLELIQSFLNNNAVFENFIKSEQNSIAQFAGYGGHCHILDWLITICHRYGIPTKTMFDDVYYHAATNGQLNVLIWFKTNASDDVKPLIYKQVFAIHLHMIHSSRDFFKDIVNNNHFEVLKYLLTDSDTILYFKPKFKSWLESTGSAGLVANRPEIWQWVSENAYVVSDMLCGPTDPDIMCPINILTLKYQSNCFCRKKLREINPIYDTLEYFISVHKYGCPWHQDTLDIIIKYGDMDLLKQIYDNSAISEYTIICSACKHNQSGILKYFYPIWKNDNTRDHENDAINYIDIAAKNGHFEILKWLCKNGCEIDSYTIGYFTHNNTDMIKWLRQNNSQWHSHACGFLAADCDIELLEWAYNNGCLLNSTAYMQAVRNNRLDIVEWLHNNGCEWHPDVFRMIIVTGNIKIFEWACQNGFSQSEEGYIYAIITHRPDMLEKILDRWPGLIDNDKYNIISCERYLTVDIDMIKQYWPQIHTIG